MSMPETKVSAGWVQASAAIIVALIMIGLMVWQGGQAREQIRSLYELEMRVEQRLERMEVKFDDLNTRISRMEGASTRRTIDEPWGNKTILQEE